MKVLTDLEQSKILAKLLSPESADMWYINGDPNKISIGKWNDNEHDEDDIPCWSLTALLSVLPYHLIIDNKRYEFRMIKGLNKNGETYAIEYIIFNTTFYFHLTGFYNNPVDACCEMVCWLKKYNKI